MYLLRIDQHNKDGIITGSMRVYKPKDNFKLTVCRIIGYAAVAWLVYRVVRYICMDLAKYATTF
ncbi:MAG: hypothetical protein M0R06_09340 [Sphaerochaeta sp.]|jgi:hypothetical protein|nr:hypothetical protein [Sphaerochaeta sp.]